MFHHPQHHFWNVVADACLCSVFQRMKDGYKKRRMFSHKQILQCVAYVLFSCSCVFGNDHRLDEIVWDAQAMWWYYNITYLQLTYTTVHNITWSYVNLCFSFQIFLGRFTDKVTSPSHQMATQCSARWATGLHCLISKSKYWVLCRNRGQEVIHQQLCIFIDKGSFIKMH